MSKCQEITDAQFDSEVVKSDKLVLVDFWAPGAAPAARLPRFSTTWPKSAKMR